MNIKIIEPHLLNDRATLQKIWVAIRTCKSNKTPSKLYEESMDKSYADMTRLIKACCASGHMSVMEHQSVTFEVEGVSRALLAQFSRHRIGVSLSVQSQRYVNMKNATVIVPKDILEGGETLEVYGDALIQVEEAYKKLVSLGIKKEDARFLLANGTTCNMVVTVNLRSLADLYKKRVATKGAQWEIKEMVETMAGLVTSKLPWYGECLEVV